METGVAQNKHLGAQERAQEVHHHDEGAFRGLSVCVSKLGRWWYEFKKRWGEASSWPRSAS